MSGSRLCQIAFALALTVLAAPIPAAADDAELTRLLRFPDVHGEQITFVYAGDIWVVEATGGTARRLTSHPGLELSPKFSPDGRFIAFSGEYSGTRQIFVVPVAGGEPRQLTFHNDVGELPPRGGFDHRVLDWTPDGEKILFLAHRLPWGPRRSRPYVVSAAGGMEEPLPIPESGTAMYSPDGEKVVFTPIEREFRTWKRYQGGQAQDVWIYDLTDDTAQVLTDFKGTDNQPMWVGETIYFTSDRGGKLNLWAQDLAGGEARQVTQHETYDVLWPSAGPRRIVYENGGTIYLFDPAAGTSQRVPIRVYGDFPGRLPYFKNVKDSIESVELSPTGKRALITARGDVFTVPAGEGQVRNLTASSGIRERDATWSPDGRWIAYWSDRSGEYELYLRAHDGSGEERRVTTDADIWSFPPMWSPDSEKLAFGDKSQRLRWLDVETGDITDVDRGERNDITTYTWSPDSRWLAYVKAAESQLASIWVHSLATGESTPLTDGFTNDYAPVFDPEGRYLYFLSDRDFNLTFSGFEFNYLYTDPTRVYVGLLTDDAPALLRPDNEEEQPGDGEGGNGEENGGGGDDGEVRIQVEGFSDRVRAIPGSPGSYRALTATADGPLYLEGQGPETRLKRFNLKTEKEEVILEGISQYGVSADGKKVIYRHRGDVGVADLKPGAKAGDGLLDLDRLQVRIDPTAEWAQMYVDAWRILRDWFYDPGMHGLDWEGIRDRYGEMLPHLAHRADLDYLLGEMGGEVGAGHVYVQPGDQPEVERVDGGLLGAEIAAHPSGAFRIAKILSGENWHESFRSPLTEPGVDVEEGDFILAVNGRSTQGVDNFYRLLENEGGQVVTLRVNDRPEEEGAREVRVRTTTSETDLRYLDWVESRRRRVEEASGGRIGYIHLPNTAVDGNRELFKTFYPQATKDALIIDVRYNQGGFIPDRMIELLNRPLLNYWAQRGLEMVTTPGFGHQGPKAALINGYAGSGGDAFPYYFKKLGMGPLIGTRTWGGLIGVSGSPSLIDGGQVTVPTFRFVDTEGLWAVEGEGVAPDIEVVDRPDLVAQGQDPSLDRAVELLLEELAANPPQEVEEPTPPGR